MNLYGNETSKAVNNFGEGRLPSGLIRAYAEVKLACIYAIQEYDGFFEKDVFESLIAAAEEIRSGKHDDQFILDLRQGGAGTSINMNINEVIASLAGIIYESRTGNKTVIDPIEHVNRFQSTNDTFPSALTIDLLRKTSAVEEKIILLQEVLVAKETEFDNVIMTGRTEMQDALPMTAGQLFAAWAGMIERDRWRISKIRERLRTVPLGGTAIGTSFGAPQKYVFLAEKHLRSITGLPLSRSQNLTDEISSSDKYSELAGCMKLIAENIYKMTGDLLFYTSSAVNEFENPHLQYGSTIMPAKKNPVILEFSRGLSIGIRHDCAKISDFSAGSQLQLNPYLPFIADSFEHVFESLFIMTDSITEKFFRTCRLNLPRIEENLILSKALINALLPVYGYNRLKELYLVIEKEKPETFEDVKKLLASELGVSPGDLEDYFDRRHLTSYARHE